MIERVLTLQFLSSAVVSSNSSPSLKEISVFLKVLWVRTTTLSPSWLMMTVGLVTLPTCRVAKPTPGTRHMKHISALRSKNKSKAKGRSTLLTEGFHIIIKVLALHQFPGCTEGVDHGDGFSETKYSGEHSEWAAVVQVSPQCVIIPRLIIMHTGGRGHGSHWLRRFLLCLWLDG